jgi:hypothetical protein
VKVATYDMSVVKRKNDFSLFSPFFSVREKVKVEV